MRRPIALGALVVALAWVGSARAQEAKFGSCYARWSEAELVVGNDLVERRWRVDGETLRASSFYDKQTKTEWLRKSAAGTPHPSKLTIAARSGTMSPVEAGSLEIEVSSAKGLLYRMQVFPEASGVEIDEQPGEPRPSVARDAEKPSGASIAESESGGSKEANPQDTPDELPLVPQHLRLTQVSLSTDTDRHNQLVATHEWMFMNNESDLLLHGDLFYVEDVVRGAGLIFLKQAPLPDARPVRTDYDLRLNASQRTFRLMSLGYASVVLGYAGGRAGRIAALQTYQRQLRRYVPGRDGTFLTNTWGDRNSDSRISAGFVAQEIAAGAKLNVDVVQIDDGWQSGRSTNSARGPGVPSAFWSTATPFWSVDAARFPQGLAPLVAQSASDGMRMGLWYAPDSSAGYANWQKDADEILGLYANQRIAYFKFDSIDMSSAKAEANLHRMFDRILVRSKGAITIDLDVTGSGRRPGYFGMMGSGPIFVENRYTDFHRYWPHLTLRNLWELAEYVDPLRLRMEFLNNTRNVARYQDDPLAPARYSADALFATVMFANPLGWFETSSLPPEFDASLTPLVAAWKKERENLYGGTIVPIGEAPDGVAWTGFASVAQQRDHGSVLVFRELNAKPDWAVEVPLLSRGKRHATVLAGHGTAEWSGDRLMVRIPETLQYLWVKVD